MAEYISKQDAVEALAKTMPTPATPDGAGEFDHEIHIADEAFADAIRIIKSLEPVDVAPVVHGEYIGEYDGYADGNPVCDMWYCSVCGCCFEDWDEKPTYNFCPNCGAKMDGEG